MFSKKNILNKNTVQGGNSMSKKHIKLGLILSILLAGGYGAKQAIALLMNSNDKNFEITEEIKKISHNLKHLALICDGNRRWATARGMHKTQGHTYSFTELAPQLLPEIFDLGIHTITFWCFSTGNWNRKDEISNLMQCFDIFTKKMIAIAHKKNIRLVHLGRKDRLPEFLLSTLEQAENITSKYEEHVLNIAIDYGGRDEILRAYKKLSKSGVKSEEITEEMIGKAMDTKDQPYPDPDFIIRPSGEQRLSGFMPWQNLYSEYYFVAELFPEFNINLIKKALLDFEQRKRTFSK